MSARCARRTLLFLLSLGGLLAAGCGWSPPGAPPPQPDTCAPSDGPPAETVQQAIAGVAAPTGSSWRESATGHTADCRLYWVQITSRTRETTEAPAESAPDSPQQVLFFDRQTPLGPATPQPRPYLNVLSSGEDTVIVQYQWRQGDDKPCCPTGIGTVRFRIGDDGTLETLDPTPGP